MTLLVRSGSADIMTQENSNEFDGESNSSDPEIMTTVVDPSSTTPTNSINRESSELPNDMTEWSPAELAAYTALRSKRKKCCVGGCTHRSLPLARSYHQLPVRNKDIWIKWIEVVRWSRNEPDWSPNGDAAPLVCSRHFPDSDFISYEASSRVRLSHTAIPIYFVDPPEGTVMDARFSKPLAIPPMLPGSRQKESIKSKSSILGEQGLLNSDVQHNIKDGRKMKNETQIKPALSLTQYKDNLGYDIEEISEGICDYQGGTDEEEFVSNAAAQYPFASINALIKETKHNGADFQSKIQSPSSTPSRSRNLKYASTASKVPALIRTNFVPFKDNLLSNSTKPLQRGGDSVNLSLYRGRLSLPSPVPMKQRTPPTKHKIGLAKCRLIVQTLENQLKHAKLHLAEQLEIPYQVVHGVWNMRDSLKDKL